MQLISQVIVILKRISQIVFDELCSQSKWSL